MSEKRFEDLIKILTMQVYEEFWGISSAGRALRWQRRGQEFISRLLLRLLFLTSFTSLKC